jgi:hypothetical protein
MRLALSLPLSLVFLAANVNAGSIEGLVSDAGPSSFEYNFELHGFDLRPHQVLDLQFDGSVYQSLSNAIVPLGFQVVILQPGNPPGTPGDYLLESMAPSTVFTPVSMGVDFAPVGQEQPGPLPFFIYQFNDQNQFVSVVASGKTTLGTDPPGVPEPPSLALAALGLLTAGFSGIHLRSSSERFGKVRQRALHLSERS